MEQKVFITVQDGVAEVCEDTVPASVVVEVLDIERASQTLGGSTPIPWVMNRYPALSWEFSRETLGAGENLLPTVLPDSEIQARGTSHCEEIWRRLRKAL